MKIVTTDSSVWKPITALLKTLQDEVTIDFTKEGIHFRCMDESGVSLVEFLWTKDKFETYEVEEEQKIGILITDFGDIIKRAGSSDKITLEFTGNSLTIIIGNCKTYNINLIASVEMPKSVPKSDFNIVFKMGLKEFQSTVEDIKIISDFLLFETDKQDILIKAFENTKGKVQIVLPKECIEKASDEEIQSSYSLDYLQKCLSAVSTLVKDIRVSFSDKKPLKIDLNTDAGEIHYYLAPKLEQEL